jgi:transcriptional regulator with XRE-family HTH domain
MAKQLTGAQRLRASLDEKGWNQTQLSERIGASSSTVCRWLSGERVPDREMSIRLANVLGIPIESWSKAGNAVRSA